MRATRANITLEPDAHNFAATCASKGMALRATDSSDCAEKAPNPPSPMLTTTRRGLLIKATAGRVVTPEQVRDLTEDDAR